MEQQCESATAHLEPRAVVDANSDIAVGIDGSEASLAALEWALDHAEDARAIRLVAAYLPQAGEPDHLARARADDLLDLTLAATSKRRDLGGVTFARMVQEGDPVEALLINAENSRLLVLGRHGTSGMIHNALGSVGDACARMAMCPVVIVPPRLRTEHHTDIQE